MIMNTRKVCPSLKIKQQVSELRPHLFPEADRNRTYFAMGIKIVKITPSSETPDKGTPSRTSLNYFELFKLYNYYFLRLEYRTDFTPYSSHSKRLPKPSPTLVKLLHSVYSSMNSLFFPF